MWIAGSHWASSNRKCRQYIVVGQWLGDDSVRKWKPPWELLWCVVEATAAVKSHSVEIQSGKMNIFLKYILHN